MFKTVILATALLSSSALQAEATKLSALDQFEDQKATILQDIKDDTIYSEIAYADVKLVKDSLDRMSHHLQGVNNIEELDQDTLVRIHNEQELINTILTMAENDSRTVCRRRGRIGTNFKTTVCETVKARRERQAMDRAQIDRMLFDGKILPKLE